MSSFNSRYNLNGTGGDNGKHLRVSKKNRKFELFPFIVCLILAIIIWIIVYNYTDDSITKTYTMPLEKSGLDYLNEQGFSVYNVSATNITIEVKGTNRDIKRFEESIESNGSAYLNFSNITEADEYRLSPTVNFPKGSGLQITEMEPKYVTVMVDRNVEKEIPFYAVVGTINADSNVIRYSPSCDVSSITISGPAKSVEKIVQAKYTINPVGIVSESLVISGFSPEYLDENGEIVNVSQYVKADTSNINVKLDVISYKKVPIKAVSSSEIYDYVITGEKTDVTLYGEAKDLSVISEFVVLIPENAEGKFTVELSADSNLPDNVTCDDLGQTVEFVTVPKQSSEKN